MNSVQIQSLMISYEALLPQIDWIWLLRNDSICIDGAIEM